MIREYLICEDGSFSVNNGAVSCSGTLATQVYNPIEPSPQEIAEAFGAGFFVFLAMFSVVWGAKHCILYFLR